MLHILYYVLLATATDETVKNERLRCIKDTLKDLKTYVAYFQDKADAESEDAKKKNPLFFVSLITALLDYMDKFINECEIPKSNIWLKFNTISQILTTKNVALYKDYFNSLKGDRMQLCPHSGYLFVSLIRNLLQKAEHYEIRPTKEAAKNYEILREIFIFLLNIIPEIRLSIISVDSAELTYSLFMKNINGSVRYNLANPHQNRTSAFDCANTDDDREAHMMGSAARTRALRRHIGESYESRGKIRRAIFYK